MPISSGGAANAQDLDLISKVRDASGKQLETTRAIASKWQAALGGLLGGLGIFAIIKDPAAIGALSPPWNYLCAAAIFAGFASAIWGSVMALRAANGVPRIGTPSELLSDPAGFAAAQKASSDLRAAIGWTIAAACLFAVALALTWFAPTPDKPQLLVTPVQGTAACGEVVSVTSATLTIKASTLQSFPVTQLRSVEPVGKCP